MAPNFLTTIGMATPETYNDNYIGFITSSMLLGAAVASMPAGLFADRFSRRAAITGAALIFIMGGIMQTACQNKETMLAGRFFAGMGIGSLGVLVPLYQSEIGHPAYRGRLTATFQFFLVSHAPMCDVGLADPLRVSERSLPAGSHTVPLRHRPASPSSGDSPLVFRCSPLFHLSSSPSFCPSLPDGSCSKAGTRMLSRHLRDCTLAVTPTTLSSVASMTR